MSKTGGGRGTNQYAVKGRSIAQDGTTVGATRSAAVFDLSNDAPVVDDSRDMRPKALQTNAPLEHRSMQPSARSMMGHFRMLRQEGMLELDPPYQRGSVWDDDKRRNLFRSFLLGLPVPAIIVNDRMSAGDSREIEPYAVIDGKQRIEAAFAWEDGELDLPASWFEPDWVESTHETPDGPYVFRHEMTPAGRRLLENRCLIPVAEAKVPTVEEEAEIFGLVNGGGVAQDDETMERASRIASGASYREQD